MNEPSKRDKIVPLVALVLSVIALSADLVSLLSADPDLLSKRVVGIVSFLLGEHAAIYVAAIPKIRFYAELWPMYLVFLSLLASISYVDYREKIIPDAITYPGIVIGLGFSAGFGHVSLVSSAVAVCGGLALIVAINWLYRKFSGYDGLGDGAIKMIGMIGAFLGPVGLAWSITVGSALGAIYGFARHRSSSATIEFGPFLAIGATLAIFFVDLTQPLFPKE